MIPLRRLKSANKVSNTPSTLRRNVDISKRKSPAAFSYYSGRAIKLTDSRVNNRNDSENQNVKTLRPNSQSARYKIKPQKRELKISSIPTYLTLLLLVIAFSYSLMLSSDPRVVIMKPSDSMRIHADVDYESVVYKVWNDSILSKFKLTIQTKSIEDEITRQFGDIDDVKINLPLLGRQAEVLISTREPAIIIQSSETAYFIDKNGYVVAELNSVINPENVIDQIVIPIVQDIGTADITQGMRIMSSKQVDFVQNLSDGLKQKNIKVVSYELPGSTVDQLNVKLVDKKYFVKFAMNGDAGQAIGALVVMNTQIEQGAIAQPQEYIDVRITGKVFVK